MKKLRRFKKIFAFILALTLVLGMSATAFAEPTDPTDPTELNETTVTKTDQTSIGIDKVLKLQNAGSVSPAETFHFTITKVGVAHSQYTLDNMPMFNPATFDISFTEGEATVAGDTNTYTLALPAYTKVGVFTYKIVETNNNTAGLNYDARELILTVYVENNPNGGFIRYATLHDNASTNKMTKVPGFNNDFESGNLAVTKNVTGNMGDKDFNFAITVTLTIPADKTPVAPVKYSVGADTDVAVNFINNTATLNLNIKHDDTITFSNLPYGTTWTVAENDYTVDTYKYDSAVIDVSTGFIEAALVTSTITNNKDVAVDTGINLDNLPYIMIIVVAAGGLVGFTLRRRFTNNK